MNEDKGQVSLSVTSGAIAIRIAAGTTKAEVEHAVSVISKILQENAESLKSLNIQATHSPSRFSRVTQESNEHDESEISRIVASNAEKLKIGQTAIVSLWVYGNMSKLQIKEAIENWGKRVADNFTGGNFNRDLIRKTLVREVGKTDIGEILYALTEKGRIEAETLVRRLKENSNVSS